MRLHSRCKMEDVFQDAVPHHDQEICHKQDVKRLFQLLHREKKVGEEQKTGCQQREQSREKGDTFPNITL